MAQVAGPVRRPVDLPVARRSRGVAGRVGDRGRRRCAVRGDSDLGDRRVERGARSCAGSPGGGGGSCIAANGCADDGGCARRSGNAGPVDGHRARRRAVVGRRRCRGRRCPIVRGGFAAGGGSIPHGRERTRSEGCRPAARAGGSRRPCEHGVQWHSGHSRARSSNRGGHRNEHRDGSHRTLCWAQQRRKSLPCSARSAGSVGCWA